MEYPMLHSPETVRETIEQFYGYNAGRRIGEGEFSGMENLTSDSFPLLSPRKPRGLYAAPESCQGILARDTLCWVDGSKIVMDGYPVEMHLSIRPEDCPKKLVSMGAYVIIFPDRKYINTACYPDRGNLDAEFTTVTDVTLTPAGINGETMLADYVQSTEPMDPAGGQIWLDTSGTTRVLMVWSASAGMWVEQGQSYIKIQSPGIGAAFRQYDGVTLTGLEGEYPELMGANILWAADRDWVLIPGLLDRERRTQTPLTISRKMPDMDFVIESGNRLWGCRYGVDSDGGAINELYASKLGDFRNWSCFMGQTTDSYRASLGADGAFTGAITHLGYPLFFRETCMHKVYGSFPANFQIQTTPCRGVQRGSEESLAILDEVLFYKSVSGICAYDGSLPREISQALGQAAYHGAAAGAYRGKYYISMADAGGEYHLFVFDRARNLWHREDSTHVLQFCACRDELFLLDEAGLIRTVSGTGAREGAVRWWAETGDLGLHTPDNKYLVRLTLRLGLTPGAQVRIFVRYDELPDWEEAAALTGTGLSSFTLPLRVHRCDHLRLRLEGVGEAKLYSLTKTAEQGSDVF